LAEGIGPILRTIRQQWKLSLREVEVRSLRFAQEKGNQSYQISASWLDRLEREEHELTVNKMIVLSEIYNLPPEQLLRSVYPGNPQPWLLRLLSVPRPDLPGCSSFPYSRMEEVLPNAEIAATSEVAVRYRNPGARLHEPSALQRWDAGSERKREKPEPSPLTKTRGPACPRGCRVCFLARKYELTPREVNLIALISSGQSSRAMSQTLGIKVETIREYCRIIHHKIGTHSRLAIGLWAIRKGMVKSAVQAKAGRRVSDA
jgi:DNA-binding CsgD family transcriptional regulator